MIQNHGNVTASFRFTAPFPIFVFVPQLPERESFDIEYSCREHSRSVSNHQVSAVDVDGGTRDI